LLRSVRTTRQLPGVARSPSLNIGEAELARRIAGFGDHAAFCRESLTIRDKTGQPVALRLSPSQVRLTAEIDKQRAKGLPVRGVVLKGRQVHMSVGVASHVFRDLAFLPGQQGLSIAHDLKAAKNIFGYVQQFNQSYKPYQGVRRLETVRAIEPGVNRAGAIEWEGKSSLVSATANNVAGGRSASLRVLHLSEFAFYRDAATYMTGLLPSIPSDPFTSIIVESTANGVGGPFYEMCQRAQDPSQASAWFFLFFAWWEHPEYAMPLSEGFEMTRSERDLAQQHNLRPEQIMWRRWAIANICEGSEDRFHQEFPSTAEEAFLTSGRPRFCLVSLGRMPVVRDPLAGELEVVRVGTEKQIQFVPNENGKGALRVWKRPVAGRLYALGADPSKGRDVGAEAGSNSDPDYATSCVLDADLGEQVAMLRARLSPYEHARYTAELARWYNMAFVVPEANELGFIEELIRCYAVERIYARRRGADDRRPPSLDEAGWLTTTTSKPQLISTFDRAIREMSVVLRDAVTVQECRTYVWDSRGATNGQPGCHDDCVIGAALATVGLSAMPRWKPAPAAGQGKPSVIDLRGARRGALWPQR